MSTDTRETTRTSIQSLLVIVQAAPIPEALKSTVARILDAVLQIIAVVETAKGSNEDAQLLAAYIAGVTDGTFRPLETGPEHFFNLNAGSSSSIDAFRHLLAEMKKGLEQILSRRLPKWIFNYDLDAAKVLGMKQRVTDALTRIQSDIALDLSHDAQLIIHDQERTFDQQFRLIQTHQKADIAGLLSKLDSFPLKKPPCLAGTRSASLLAIEQWLATQWHSQYSGYSGRGLCLQGSVGTGRSSISASIAQEARGYGCLGGEFYYMMGQNHSNREVVKVLTRQLTSWWGGQLRFEIASVIRDDDKIFDKSLEVQFQKLIQEPMETLWAAKDCPALIIVLDGLDECDEEDVTQLLSVIGQGLAKLPPAVRYILASRPGPRLLGLYASEPMRWQLDSHSLDEDEDEMGGDIETFFRHKLPEVVWQWVKDPIDWPGEDMRRRLVRMAQGMCIWAAMVVRMISDSAIQDPDKQLETLISTEQASQVGDSDKSPLDALYTVILERACSTDPSADLFALFRDVLGILLVASVPMNVNTLSSLLCPDDSDSPTYTHRIRTTVLSYLQAVLVIPDVDDVNPSRDASEIRFRNQSFQDYLCDKNRCDPRFVIDLDEYETKMATLCIRRMDDLKHPNICDLDPSKLNTDVQDLSDRLRLRVSSGLQYACAHWPEQVSRAPHESDELHSLFAAFVMKRLMYWLEVLSLTGALTEMEQVIAKIELVEAWILKFKLTLAARVSSTALAAAKSPSLGGLCLEGSGAHVAPASGWRLVRLIYHAKGLVGSRTNPKPRDGKTSQIDTNLQALSLLQELKHFVRLFATPITLSSPHIYRSALSLTPSNSSLSHVYGHMAEDGPRFRRGRLPDWPPAGPIAVLELAWSPDGKTIVSSSHDFALQLWETSTGAAVGEPLRGHTDLTLCLSWSPDGKIIASASRDSTIRLWNVRTRVPIGGPLNHELVVCITWLPDSTAFISRSEDGRSCRWDVSSRVKAGQDVELNIQGCRAWSPDGTRVVSSEATILELWDAASGEAVGDAMGGHGESDAHVDSMIWCVAWSPDGETIASSSGDDDHNIHLWDAHTGAHVGVLEGHEGGVQCIAWSPDGTMIASGSSDWTIRMWDTHTAECVGGVLEGHIGTVYCIAWSPDGMTIASGSRESTTIMLWNINTGAPSVFGTLPDSHTRRVYRLTFSHDNEMVASASEDGTFRVWNTTSGALVGRPVVHSPMATHFEFSEDGTCVRAEDDESHIVWEVRREGTGDTAPKTRAVRNDVVQFLTVDRDGWVLDPNGRRMFWMPDQLLPTMGWGRVVAHGSMIAMEMQNVPILDISGCMLRI
ncbi:hypothetical protein FRB97_003832 [Tulasnella sp. 331]|nr:hypothetical protein FRB97_003832 [Tulasnella sp. 331]